MFESPSALAGPSRAVEIAPAPARTVHRLTSWLPGHRSGEERVVLGEQALPAEAGATLSGPMRVLCLRPGDWLLVYPDGAAPKPCDAESRSESLVRVDLSDGLPALAVSGPATRELLAKGCGLDMHPKRFPAGRCARTRFAGIPVVLDSLDAGPAFRLYVRRSYRDYLHEWLLDAALEFKEADFGVLPGNEMSNGRERTCAVGEAE